MELKCYQKKKLKFNQCTKTDKMWYIIYADNEYLVKKTDGCAND